MAQLLDKTEPELARVDQWVKEQVALLNETKANLSYVHAKIKQMK